MANGVISKFHPAPLRITKQDWIAQRIAANKMDQATAEQLWGRLAQSEIFENDEYQVILDKTPKVGFKNSEIWHLSIKRLDNDPARDWRDLQAIKNALAGEEVEAIEIYPAESRLCDSSNRTHLWAFHTLSGANLPKFPVGWNMRVVSDTALTEMDGQRPR